MASLRRSTPRRHLSGRGPARDDETTAMLFAASRAPLLLIDSAQIIRAANSAACELLAKRRSELCGHNWRQFFHLERELAQNWRRNPLVQCLLSQRAQTLDADTVLVTRSGLRLYVQGNILPAGHNGRPQALICLHQPESTHDHESQSLNRRTEHELLLQHMARLNTVSELATGIAHEMNQPLSAIMSFTQASMRLLAEEPPDIDRASEALAESINQARRAAGILERLRAFVGRQGMEVRPVAINQVVINALTLLSNKLSEAKVRVSLSTQPCPPVLADALQLEQVMVNLIQNAVESMHETPTNQRTLNISTRAIASRVHVAVADSGHGLGHYDSKLFTRFFTTKSDGMGLGLSISRTILEAAGGEIKASNVETGGACFEFWLPVFISEERRHEHAPA